MAKRKDTEKVLVTLKVRIELELERVVGDRQAVLVLFREDRGSAIEFTRVKDGPVVGFASDGQRYRFNLRSVIDQAAAVVSADPPNRIGDSGAAHG